MALRKQNYFCKLQGIKNRDWEDIAIGNGPKQGKKYLYVAEIGDNKASYDFKYLYRFEEPLLKNGAEQSIIDVETLVIKMPDGKRDTETVMIDQSTNDLLHHFKARRESASVLAKIPYADTLKPVKVLELPFNLVTSGFDFKRWERGSNKKLHGHLLLEEK